MIDKIFIRNLKQNILVGINPEERIHKQPVYVNVTMDVDCAKACKSDSIEDAVDYSVIHDKIVDHLNSSHYDLIETLAESISEICLSDERVISCTVSIDKPQALQHAESVAVEIFRNK